LEQYPKAVILSDEIYSRILYDGEEHVSMLQYESIRDRLIVIDGWSKTYAMTGWRLGYGVWPSTLFEYAEKLAVNSYSCPNAASQHAGIAALEGPQDQVGQMLDAFDERRKAVVDGLNAISGITCVKPKGAFYAFPNVQETGFDTRDLQQRLLEEAGVALVAGTSFGALGEGYLRVSYANSLENVNEAVSRINDFLS
jgi:aspartate/methionine/tyrosine aminotransferase